MPGKSFDVSPTLPFNHPANLGLTDSKFGSKGLLSELAFCVQQPDFPNAFVIQSCRRKTDAERLQCGFIPKPLQPSLIGSIAHVIPSAANKKMARIAAQFNITMMANHQANRNRSNSKNERQSVRPDTGAIQFRPSVTSVFVNATLPQPTIVWPKYFDVSPESFSFWGFLAPSGGSPKLAVANTAFVRNH